VRVLLAFAICFGVLGCASADRRQFTLALRPFEKRTCSEEDVRVLESKHFEDTDSTVYVLSACGRIIELEERVYEEVQGFDPDQAELLEALLDSGKPPADVMRRASWQVRGACERRAEPALQALWNAASVPERADGDRLRRAHEQELVACRQHFEPRYLGSDVGGDQERRRYWFSLGGTVYFVSHRLGSPTCNHYLRAPHICPL
jgi:hypothetical protein